MARGGARLGAGRPKMSAEVQQANLLAKQAVMTEELLVPSFKASNLGQDELELSPDDIKKAYGINGLRVWKTWYSISTPDKPIRHGNTFTKWKLKLKMVVAAKQLLDRVKHELPFPSDVLKECAHRRAYDKWVLEYNRHAQEFAKEHGHKVTEPPPYKPLVIRRTSPSSKAQFAGWRELIDGPSNGFSDTYSGFVPDESEVSY